MEPDQSPLHLSTDRWAAADPPLPSATFRPLVDETDGLIRALFDCGFTSAAVQSRQDIGVELSEQLTALIDTLDEAIRGIRHALGRHEAA